jgi:hypothetical protein
MNTKINLDIDLLKTMSRRFENELKKFEFCPKITSINISDIEKSGMTANEYLEKVKETNKESEKINWKFTALAIQFLIESHKGMTQETELIQYVLEQTNSLKNSHRVVNGVSETIPTKCTISGIVNAFLSVVNIGRASKATTTETITQREIELICKAKDISEETRKIFKNSHFVAIKKSLIASGEWQQIIK